MNHYIKTRMVFITVVLERFVDQGSDLHEDYTVPLPSSLSKVYTVLLLKTKKHTLAI